jgi:hypothetical protein
MVAIFQDVEYTCDYYIMRINANQLKVIEYLQDNSIIDEAFNVKIVDDDDEAIQKISPVLLADDIDLTKEKE